MATHTMLLFICAWIGLCLAKAPYCLPHEPCFPSDEAISNFNRSVNGALIRVHPCGRPCYAGTYDAEACRLLADNKGDSEYRETLPGRHSLVSRFLWWTSKM